MDYYTRTYGLNYTLHECTVPPGSTLIGETIRKAERDHHGALQHGQGDPEEAGQRQQKEPPATHGAAIHDAGLDEARSAGEGIDAPLLMGSLPPMSS